MAQLMVLAVPTSAPRIILQGEPLVVVEAGQKYQDTGATATDATDDNVTPSLTSDITSFNSIQLGNQEVCYTMRTANSQGLFATPVCRVIQVRDTTPPVRTQLREADVLC
jgi:hypothetical protein